MAQVSVDTDGLHSAGTGLANTAGPGGGAPRCDPAATDPVSVSVAETLTQWSQVLWTLMEHAGQQREAGGMSLTRTAEYLGSLDDAGAGRIASVLGSSPSTAAPESLPPATPGAVPAPTLPHLPQIPSPPPMTGEQVAALVYAQPDPARLREFANQWRTQIAPHILSAADHTRRYGNSVAQAWDSGTAPVSDNLLQHADWLESSLHSSALQLAQAAEQAAGHADTVIQSTPTPQEFHEVHARLQTAVKHYQVSGDPTEAIALTQHLREKRTTAVAGYQTYAAAAPTTTGAAANPPVPAPPIVRGTGPGDSSETNANQLNPGAHGDHAGDGNEAGKGAGDDTQRPSTADIGPPLGQSGTPPIAPAQQQPVTTSQATAGAPVMANIAGEVMGAGLGTAGQLANSMHGVSGSPLSALSGLASPSGLGGMPHMGGPQAPSGGDGPEAESMPDLENDHDYGSGGTTPAGGGGGGDGGGGAPVSPPVSGTVSAANPTVGPPVGTSPSGGVPTAAGGSGIIAPPMMGGMGRGNEEERKAAEKRRVVLRPVVNSEPVFGAAERQRSTQRRRKEER